MNRNFKGVWIPKHIWLDKNLSVVERCLLAEIDSLSSTEKGCIASNGYLAELFGVSVPTITRGIGVLESLGYVVRLSQNGKRRELKPLNPNQNDEDPNQNDEAILENSRENSIESTTYSQEKVLMHQIKGFFYDHQLDKTAFDFRREMPHCKKLAKKIMSHENVPEFLEGFFATFIDMKKNDKFYQDQPFLPSIANSSGTYARVVERMNGHKQKEVTPEQEEFIEELWK